MDNDKVQIILSYHQKPSVKLSQKLYKQKHKKKISEICKRYYEKNKTSRIKYSTDYYEKNKHIMLSKNKKRYYLKTRRKKLEKIKLKINEHLKKKLIIQNCINYY